MSDEDKLTSKFSQYIWLCITIIRSFYNIPRRFQVSDDVSDMENHLFSLLRQATSLIQVVTGCQLKWWANPNHGLIKIVNESHFAIRFDYKKIWFERLWFDLNLIWVYHDMICDVNKSHVSLTWGDRYQLGCSTTFADSHILINKSKRYAENSQRTEVVSVLCDYQVAFCNIWCYEFSTSRTCRISESEILIWFEIWARMICDLGCDLCF